MVVPASVARPSDPDALEVLALRGDRPSGSGVAVVVGAPPADGAAEEKESYSQDPLSLASILVPPLLWPNANDSFA